MPVAVEEGIKGVEDGIEGEAEAGRGWQRCGLRLVEVGLSCLLASQCDNFDAFASVVGSIFIPIILSCSATFCLNAFCCSSNAAFAFCRSLYLGVLG